jgi:hypothetical protein
MSATVRRYRPKPKSCAGRAGATDIYVWRTLGGESGGSFWSFECWVSRGNPAAQRAVPKTIPRLEVIEAIKRFICINQPSVALTMLRERCADRFQ